MRVVRTCADSYYRVYQGRVKVDRTHKSARNRFTVFEAFDSRAQFGVSLGRSILAIVMKGLGIGIAVSEFFGQLADAIMVALAAGTFIYVGATEIVAEEFECREDKWKKFFSLSGTKKIGKYKQFFTTKAVCSLIGLLEPPVSAMNICRLAAPMLWSCIGIN